MKSKSAATTVVATVLVVILAIAVSTTESANIVEEFSGDWYDAYFNNNGESIDINPETDCFREKYVIDPSTGSLKITETTYKVSDGSVEETSSETYEKVNDDPKTNTEWKTQNQDARLKLQKITKDFAVYTLTYQLKEGVVVNVLTKNAVITDKQLEEAKKIAKENKFKGDELSKKYNTHCAKVPPP